MSQLTDAGQSGRRWLIRPLPRPASGGSGSGGHSRERRDEVGATKNERRFARVIGLDTGGLEKRERWSLSRQVAEERPCAPCAGRRDENGSLTTGLEEATEVSSTA